MISEQEVYLCFRDVQSQILNRKWRPPKDWEAHFNTKMKPDQREALRKMKRYLLTKWSNIDLELYFKCGFELYKTFSYHQFFKEQVINLYIQKVKNIKRKSDGIKKQIIETAKYVKKTLLELDLYSLKEYCQIKRGFRYRIVDDYIKGKVSQYFLGYVIYIGYIPRSILDDDHICEILQKWNTIRNEVIENKEFLDKVKDGIENRS